MHHDPVSDSHESTSVHGVLVIISLVPLPRNEVSLLSSLYILLGNVITSFYPNVFNYFLLLFM